MPSTQDSEGTGSAHKKRRLPGACDYCKQKKGVRYAYIYIIIEPDL